MDTREQLVKVKLKSISIGYVDIQFSDGVTCLIVVFDNEMPFSTHNKLLAGKCFYRLRQKRTLRRSFYVNAAKNTSQCVHNKSDRLL